MRRTAVRATVVPAPRSVVGPMLTVFALLAATNVCLGALCALGIAWRAGRVAARDSLDAEALRVAEAAAAAEAVPTPPDAAAADAEPGPPAPDGAALLSGSWLAVAKREGITADQPIAVALSVLAEEIAKCLALSTDCLVGDGTVTDRTSNVPVVDRVAASTTMTGIGHRLSAHRTRLDHAFRQHPDLHASISDVLRTLTFELTWIAEQAALIEDPKAEDADSVADPTGVLAELQDHLMHLEAETLDRLEALTAPTDADDPGVTDEPDDDLDAEGAENVHEAEGLDDPREDAVAEASDDAEDRSEADDEPTDDGDAPGRAIPSDGAAEEAFAGSDPAGVA